MKIDVLGTEYIIIESTQSADKALMDIDGYCDTSCKLCVVDEMKDHGPRAKKNMLFCMNRGLM